MSWFESKEEKTNRMAVEKEQLLKEFSKKVNDDLIIPRMDDLISKLKTLEQAIDALSSQVLTLQNSNDVLKHSLKEYSDLLDATEEQNEILKVQLEKASESERARNSDEPYAHVISWHLDENGNLETSIDWNKAFIQHLIQHGYRGSTDEQIIERWLRGVYTQFAGIEG